MDGGEDPSPTAILSLPKIPIPCYPTPMKNPLPNFQPRQNLPVIPTSAGIHHSCLNTTLPPIRAFSHHSHTILHITNTINDAIKKRDESPKRSDLRLEHPIFSHTRFPKRVLAKAKSTETSPLNPHSFAPNERHNPIHSRYSMSPFPSPYTSPPLIIEATHSSSAPRQLTSP